VADPENKKKGLSFYTVIIIVVVAVVAAAFYFMKGEGKKASHKDATIPAVEVLVTEVVKKDVPLIKEWIGTTDGNVNAHIHAKISGYLLNRNYDEGTSVKEGQLMFEIDPRQYQAALDQAQGDLVKSVAAQRKSRDDVRRYKQLVGSGAVSRKELDDASRTNDMNEAAVTSAKAALEQARLNLNWTKIYSPISGLAGVSVAQVGDLRDPSKELTTVSVIDPIKVVFPISENEYIWHQKMRENQSKTGPQDSMEGDSPNVTIILNDGSTYPEKGKFTYADRQIDPKTGTITVYVTAPNPRGFLRPGQYAKVRSQVGVFNDALVIPRRAVIETQGTTQVAVVDKDDKVEIRNVSLGYTAGDIRIVNDGLKEGEIIVVEGFLKIHDGTMVSVKKYTPETSAPDAGASQTSTSATSTPEINTNGDTAPKD